MTIRHYRSRRIRQGYTDMGQVQMPPLPNYIIMLDRNTRTPYVLTHDGSTVSLSASIPPGLDKSTYGPYEGPYTNSFRLYNSGGFLSGEPENPNPPLNENQAVYARLGLTRRVILVTVDADGNIVYTIRDL